MRGFFFTISLFGLLSLILSATLLQHELQQNALPLLVTEKVAYAWDDVSEDLYIAAGVNVSKTGNNLVIFDELPAAGNASQFLANYFAFVRQFYNSTDSQIKLLTENGQELTDFTCFGKQSCSDDEVQLQVLPSNITYSYPDWKKGQVDVTCYQAGGSGFPPCDFSSVNSFNVSIKLTQLNFTCNPAIFNNCTHSDIEWNDFDKVFGCTSGTGCVNYSLSITDASSKTYSCQGVYGSNSGNRRRVNCDATTFNWLDNDDAVLTIKSSPCQVRFRYGKDGRFRIEGSAPGGGDCDVNMTTAVSFTFNATDFYTDFPTNLEVRDNLFNNSMRARIQ